MIISDANDDAVFPNQLITGDETWHLLYNPQKSCDLHVGFASRCMERCVRKHVTCLVIQQNLWPVPIAAVRSLLIGNDWHAPKLQLL